MQPENKDAQMSSSENKIQTAIWMIGMALFGAFGYWGWKFIDAAGKSAEGLQAGQGASAASQMRSGGDGFAPASASGINYGSSAESVSSGQDVAIEAGEFSYRNGRPRVLLSLRNSGSFAVSSVYVSLTLYLDGKADAKAIGIPVKLSSLLAPGGETVVAVPLDDEKWYRDAVRQAASRRMTAQIVAVGDGSYQDIDYPQTGAAVSLSQTANEWDTPAETPAPRPDNGEARRPERVTASEPRIDMPAPKVPPPTEPAESSGRRVQRAGTRIDLDDDEAVSRLPDEPGVISVEVQEGRK